MSRLLLAFQFDGSSPEPAAWAAMRAATMRNAGATAARECMEQAYANYRVCGVRTSAADAPVLQHAADGRLHLVDTCEAWQPEQPWPDHEPPRAQVVLDVHRGTVILRRDRLGQAPLVWARVRGGIVVASREGALIAHPEVDRAWDDDFLAAHFGLADPDPDRTLFRGVRAVPPGGCVEVGAEHERLEVAGFEPDAEAFSLADRAAAERYAELLAASVARTTRTMRRLGVSLSAGFDSSSILALLPASLRNDSTLALNYGTDVDGTVDERPLALALAKRMGVACESIDSNLYPGSFAQASWFPDPGYPYLNPYRPLKQAVYGAFEAAGVDVVLSGHFGDHWAASEARTLLHAWHGRRWDVLAHGLRARMQTKSCLLMPWRDAGLRQLARAALRAAPRVRSPDWLRAPWREHLAERARTAHAAFEAWPDPAHAAYNFGPTSALDAAYEGHYADRHGLRLLHPYRDWRFLRFALSLPAHMSVRDGMTKWIGRQALTGRLPDEWRLRPKQGDLLPQLSRLCAGQARRSFEDAIEAGRPVWERFVDPRIVARRVRAAADLPARDELLLILAGFGKWSVFASTSERH